MRNVPKIGCPLSKASMATISARPRQRRNAISSASVVSQPSGEGGRSSTARAPARAQATDVRFVLDFLLQGQQSPFVLGREKGYYAAQNVNFAAFDPGRGGADSITKVASRTHDVGFGDLSAMIEFNASNPG